MTNQELYEFILSKKGAEKITTAWTIKDILINTLASMFEYKNLPEELESRKEFIERFFVMNGNVCLWKLDNKQDPLFYDKLIISIGGEANLPDAYGMGSKYIASTFNGYVKTMTPGEECAVGYNNSLHISDMMIISEFADMITEMIVSMKTNVLYSRNKPVFRAENDKEKAAIQEAFKNIKNDLEPIIIMSKNVLSEELGKDDTIKLLDITDVKNADKMQFIIKGIEDAFRMFYTLYGQAVQGNSKLAQQTVREVEGNTSTSFIIPNDRLAMRRRWINESNKLFNTEIEVEFSDAWRTEEIKYKKEADLDENGELEEIGEETEQETVKETKQETVEEKGEET